MREGVKTKTQKLVISALFAALIFVSTAYLSVPVFSGFGYIHLGDAFILLACWFVGGWYAIGATVIGSSLADLMVFPIYTPATFIVKGVMAIVVILISGGFKNNLRTALAFASGALVMIAGYFLTDLILAALVVQDFEVGVAFTNILPNVLQGAVGAALATGAVAVAKRARLFPLSNAAKTDEAVDIGK